MQRRAAPSLVVAETPWLVYKRSKYVGIEVTAAPRRSSMLVIEVLSCFTVRNAARASDGGARLRLARILPHVTQPVAHASMHCGYPPRMVPPRKTACVAAFPAFSREAAERVAPARLAVYVFVMIRTRNA